MPTSGVLSLRGICSLVVKREGNEAALRVVPIVVKPGDVAIPNELWAAQQRVLPPEMDQLPACTRLSQPCHIWLGHLKILNQDEDALTWHVREMVVPVESVEALPLLVQLVPFKARHFSVMPVPVVVAAAGLCILIPCTKQRQALVMPA